MMYELNKLDYDKQDHLSTDEHPSLYESSYPTKEVDQSCLKLPPTPYNEFSQESLSSIHCIESNIQNHDQTPAYQQQITGIVLANKLTTRKPLLIPVTRNLRIVYIVSGIFNLLWASIAIGLEIGLMMYSYSTFYQGLWLSGLLIGLAIVAFDVACRASHYMIYIIHLFGLVFCFTILGATLSFHDVHVKNPCFSEFHPTACDTKLGTTLRWFLAGELCLAMLQCISSMIYISRVKSTSKIPPPPTTYPQPANKMLR